ncbi:mannitol dehydrogenase family protein [Ochrobactrum sp. Marseille-Q0166]|uniref:mannitol dehydrogenase family protein n=1 Tax=Ochrobactrum sp. Marseille-Q0166 TaxID=2761105 RepID=UPI001655F4F0|nr:mannitol dehydrogenase family protein [Ochrobactrum sp. Marseille-Q0166]MBC8718636.1 mannitol dehydrogenase family protein [Ochrobactrum sp. Marseille-Q0166]
MRLSAKSPKTNGVSWPDYEPELHDAGILHLGLGAFARAHIAAYTDAAISASGGDWRIVGVSLRGTEVANALNAQNGRYTLVVRGVADHARVIGSIAQVLSGDSTGIDALDVMSRPNCRIVSLTVTEKGYGLLRNGGCDLDHAAVKADLTTPSSPRGVLGLLTLGLKRRFEAGWQPFTVLCCDNLPNNGALLKSAVIDFAQRAHGNSLAQRIVEEVAFPSTMVDRITPKATDQTRTDAELATGFEDAAAIETEAFSQWVIEDNFPAGRPAWEAMGATFTDKVEPFEKMKLRMLNGCHSMLAYTGFLCGKTYVRDVMADAQLNLLVRRYLMMAAQTLPASDIDINAYAQALIERFSNPSIAHETRQIAADGTEKMPQRIFAPAIDMLEKSGDVALFAFATAAWMRYGLGYNDDGDTYHLADPRSEEISKAVCGASNAVDIFEAYAGLRDLLPQTLKDAPFAVQVQNHLQSMLSEGMVAAVAKASQ